MARHAKYSPLGTLFVIAQGAYALVFSLCMCVGMRTLHRQAFMTLFAIGVVSYDVILLAIALVIKTIGYSNAPLSAVIFDTNQSYSWGLILFIYIWTCIVQYAALHFYFTAAVTVRLVVTILISNLLAHAARLGTFYGLVHLIKTWQSW